MERLFETHRIRKTKELGGLWDFWTLKDMEHPRKIVVPSCLETYPGLENYRGISTYQTTLWGGGNLHFIFKGISHTGTVYLDGKEIGYHYNAFTPFEITVPGVDTGRHLLNVVVDNSMNEESALHVVNDYFTYGGINRPVFIEEVPDLYIERIHVIPRKENGTWTGEVSIRLRNLRFEAEAALQLYVGEKRVATIPVTIPSGCYEIQEVLTFDEVEEYTPAHPKLYFLRAELEQDQQTTDDLIERIGFRQITIKGTDILWNGEKIKIKGFNRHEDHALYGCALPLEAMDYDLRLMEDMHANAVRTCHYPNDELFLDLCDEKGIMVWEEGHARGLSEEQMRHKNFRSQSLQVLEEMVDNHSNHPSIFTWGILNECASETEYGREIYKEQFEKIKSMDPSRPLTFASCKYGTDICFDLVDIVSMNNYPLWYHDSPASEYLQEVYDWIQTTEGRGKPYIVSEIGAGAIPGCHAPGNPKWSEERQAKILKEQLEAVLSHEKTTGAFIWQFCDGRVSEEWFASRPRSMNNKGVVDEYRRKKMSYETVKEIFKR